MSAYGSGILSPIHVTSNEQLGLAAAALRNATVCVLHIYKHQARLEFIMLALRKATGEEEVLLLVRLGCTAVACFSDSVLCPAIQNVENFKVYYV